MANSNLKIAAMIAVVMLLVGVIFVSLNFISPHNFLVKQSVQVAHEVVTSENYTYVGSMQNLVLNGNMFYPPLQSTEVRYQYFPSVYVTKGQTRDVSWYSDIWVDGFIFTQEQFTNFQKIVQDILDNKTAATNSGWLNNRYGITYEATGSANKNGDISYNVTESGYYVGVVTNIMYVGGAFTTIYDFHEGFINYTYQTRYTNEVKNVTHNDNLYLYIGSSLMITGALVLFVFQISRKKHVAEALGG